MTAFIVVVAVVGWTWVSFAMGYRSGLEASQWVANMDRLLDRMQDAVPVANGQCPHRMPPDQCDICEHLAQGNID